MFDMTTFENLNTYWISVKLQQFSLSDFKKSAIVKV